MALAAAVSSASVLLGVLLALLVVRTDLPGRGLWTVLFALPLGVPAFVSSYTWVATFYAVAPASTFIYGLRGAVIVLTLSLYPYVYLPVVAALRGLDPAQEEAARALGVPAWLAFLRVTLPQLRAAVAGGALLIALHMFAEFGALELLRYRTLTTAIVQRVTVLAAPEAARSLSVALTLGSLVLLTLDLFLRGRPSPTRTGTGVAREPARWRLGSGRWPWLAASVLLLTAALGVPLYAMFGGLVKLAATGGPFDWARLARAAADTSRYALAAALWASVLAVPVSLLVVRHPGRLATLTERATWVAHSLPGVIVSLALVYLSTRWLYPLYQTNSLLVAGYVILFLPVAVGAQRVGFAHASERLADLSRSLGHGPAVTFLRVTLPLALPGIVAGAVLVLLNAGKELTMTLLLHPTGVRTLATALWATTEGEVLDFARAAPYAVALVAITALPTYVLIRRSLGPRASAPGGG